KDIHPTVLVKGYNMAAEKAMVVLNKIAVDVTEKDVDLLRKIAMTAMTGKGAEANKGKLADIVVKAVKQVVDDENGKKVIDIDNIKLEKKVGAGVEDTELVQGLVLDKERVHPAMPRLVKDAKIALIDAAIEIQKSETEAKIQITAPEQLTSFLAQEEKMLRDMVEQIVKSGATVVFCQKGIDDMAQHFLAKKGIYAARRVKKSDMELLARATGGNVVSSLKDLEKSDLGHAGAVEEQKVGDEQMTYVRDCKNPKGVTILVRGGTEHVVDEIKRALEDAVGGVASAVIGGKVVAGAGAPEVELARNLRKFSESLSGREQLAVLAFAEAMEIIPRTLAENAGMDPIDILTDLKAAHDKGQVWAGVDVFKGEVVDSWKDGVVEPLKIKTQAIKSASEVATMILRIDDVIASSGSSDKGGGMPPGGMGGMPPGMGY
ncbi:thermosome subunit, partial [Candidatus Woesearchaeota archaeon]|nr:thermosome subunit [Candidatus Woesearchaeota archaeon]